MPEVTIVMPVRNEASTIAIALASALLQQTTFPFEVVIADGVSDDGTRAIIDEVAEGDPRVRVVDNPERGTPQALNVALAAARGTFWVRLDGHSVVPPDYVDRLVGHLRAGECEAAGGVVRALGDTAFGKAVAGAHDSRFGIGNARHHYATETSEIDHIAHGAYRVDVSRQIGGFDTELVRNQDFDFDFRYRATGARMMIDPGVEFHRRVRETPRSLAKQFYQYGYWKYVVLRRHPASLHVRWLVPPALVTALVGATLMSWTRAGRLLLVVTASAYAAVLLAGSVTIGRRVGFGLAPRAAVGLAIMHLSWGTGFVRSALVER
ncbi:MAG TPA: glycosyltransferase family 2 protein [Acidimicrobiales bacterium]|nr:glycosyltransferase family 2 protein [Acidimicrobiales bacterium]